MSNETIKAALADLGLTVEARFVPFSQSRNRLEKGASLNWNLSVRKDGKEILTTPYSAGIGHAPSYKYGNREAMAAARIECETGKPATGRGAALMPDPLDVFYSLTMDSEIINYASFESWADEYGFNPDSRKDEAIYKACLNIALALRAAIGEAGLDKLHNAFQDY